jgi:putative flippase GtrA
MKTKSTNNKAKEWKRFIFSTLLTGFGMWVTGGLYHNLILPNFNEKIQAHHEGLGIAFIAYLILAFMMTYLYSIIKPEKDSLIKGIKLGITIGILWVFPHGLTMAAVHESSIIYELKNTLYHIIEQGIGGIIIFYVSNYFMRKKN